MKKRPYNLAIIPSAKADKFEVITDMEALKSIFVLIVLLFMVRKRLHLGHAFLLATGLFGLLHQISPKEMALIALETVLDSSTLIVLGSLYLIRIMEKSLTIPVCNPAWWPVSKALPGTPRRDDHPARLDRFTAQPGGAGSLHPWLKKLPVN